jgi:hypothetical protein
MTIELQWEKGFAIVSNPIWLLEVRDHSGTHKLQSRYQRVLSWMSFQTIGGTLSGLGLSPMSSITVLVFSIMRGVMSLIVKGKTRLHDLVAADEDRPLLK